MVVCETLQLGVHVDLQKYHEATFAHAPAVIWIQDRTASGSDELVFMIQQIVEYFALQTSKFWFAVVFEDFGDACANAFDDGVVGIFKVQAEVFG